MKASPTWTAALVFAVVLVSPVEGRQGREQRKLDPRQMARLVAEGDKLVAEGKPLEARSRYAAVVEQDPANGPVALKLARVCETAQDWDCAVNAYQMASANTQGGEKADAHAGLAAAYVRKARYREAAENARSALALNPAAAPARVTLAYSLVRLGSAQEAAAAAREATVQSPASAVAHAALGEALLKLGNVAEAESAFRKALEIDAKTGEAYAGLAEIQYRREDLDGAIASASKALEVSPHVTWAYAIRGMAHIARGNTIYADTDLTMALRFNADDAEAHLALAQVQRRQGNRDAAIGSCRRALALNSDLGVGYLELGDLLVAKGQYAEARDALLQAVARMQQSARAQLLLGIVYDKEKQVDPALEAYTRAAELDPKLADAHYGRGKLLREQKKDVAGAVASLEKAVELQPENANYLTDFGVALYDVKQGDRAMQVLERATGMADYKNPLGFAVLGLALKDRQSFADALTWFSKAIEGAPKWWLPYWGAAWSQFGLIKKGCPCGPEDEERVRAIKEHFDTMVSLQGSDPALQTRVEALLKGQKVK